MTRLNQWIDETKNSFGTDINHPLSDNQLASMIMLEDINLPDWIFVKLNRLGVTLIDKDNMKESINLI